LLGDNEDKYITYLDVVIVMTAVTVTKKISVFKVPHNETF